VHINEVVWHGIGEITGGTTASAQAIHFQSPEGAAVYQEYQTAFTEYDVALANQYLDDVGLDARDPGTGFRLRADTGEVLELIITDSAPLSPGGAAFLALVEKYFEDVGVMTTLDVIPSASCEYQMVHGEWHLFIWWGEPVDGLSELDLFAYPTNIFVCSIDDRNWPMSTLWLQTGGEEGWELTEEAKGLNDLYLASLAEPDVEKSHEYVWEALRTYWIGEGPYHIAATRGLPSPVFVKKNFRNVPNYGILSPWAPGCPGSGNSEQFFFKTE